MIAVQIHLFSCYFSLPLPSFGLSPSGPSPPSFCSIQRRAVSWHTGGHAQKKQFKLGFSSETEPEGVSMHTHTVDAKFCLPKRQDSGLQHQYYSPPLWPLSRFENMSLTVRSCPFLSLNRDMRSNMYQQRRTAVWRTPLISCLKGKCNYGWSNS